MVPYYSEAGIRIFLGDCQEVMRGLAESSVDSVVTDPPYELGFMAKTWDRSGIAYDANVWRECLRVLKPGGHLLAFGGSRTYHRLACAIEDAGFEIRDQIQWIYGSGFPKSLDVSKAIDAAAGVERTEGRRTWSGGQRSGGIIRDDETEMTAERVIFDAPLTDAAKQWNGWGTALKPAHEPIVLARKPLIGTVVENVLKHGTGGLNVDGCRIEGSYETRDRANGGGNSMFGTGSGGGAFLPTEGRWPANVIHDGSEEVLAGFPETTVGTFSGHRNEPKTKNAFSSFGLQDESGHAGSSGSAARFFKECKPDLLCALCALPVAENSLIIQPCNANGAKADSSLNGGKRISGSVPSDALDLLPPNGEDSLERSSWFVGLAKNLLQNSPGTTESSVQRLAVGLDAAQRARSVWSAKSLCDLCAIGTALILAEIKLLDFSREESQVILGFTGNFSACIPIQNLALSVAQKASIDTTQTTLSLLKLFGSASPAITASTSATTNSAPSRFTYQPKASKEDREEGLEGAPQKEPPQEYGMKAVEGDPRKPARCTALRSVANTHPTVKPTDLMRYLCRLITPPGGTVLDPFCGSGSTGKAAILERLNFIGIDLSAEYCELAEKRIEAVTRQGLLMFA